MHCRCSVTWEGAGHCDLDLSEPHLKGEMLVPHGGAKREPDERQRPASSHTRSWVQSEWTFIRKSPCKHAEKCCAVGSTHFLRKGSTVSELPEGQGAREWELLGATCGEHSFTAARLGPGEPAHRRHTRTTPEHTHLRYTEINEQYSVPLAAAVPETKGTKGTKKTTKSFFPLDPGKNIPKLSKFLSYKILF